MLEDFIFELFIGTISAMFIVVVILLIKDFIFKIKNNDRNNK